MKRTLLMLLVLLSITAAHAHNITLLCWNNGTYSFNATQVPSGLATIRVYSNSNYTGLIETKTITVIGTQANYYVNQPVRTTKVYVKVTWSDNFVNQNPSGTNQCSTVPIRFGPISAQNIENSTIITFQVESSEDANSITINYYMPDGTIKHFPIVFLDKLYIGDIWVITLNNETGMYTVKKK